MVTIKVLGGLEIEVKQSGDDFVIVAVAGRWVKHQKHIAWLYRRIDAHARSYCDIWRALEGKRELIQL